MGALSDASPCVTAHGALNASADKVPGVAEDRSSSQGMEQASASVMDVKQKESLLLNWAMESC